MSQWWRGPDVGVKPGIGDLAESTATSGGFGCLIQYEKRANAPAISARCRCGVGGSVPFAQTANDLARTSAASENGHRRAC